MKNLRKVLLILLLLCLSLAFASCDNTNDSDKGGDDNNISDNNGDKAPDVPAATKKDITGVTFSGATFVYDGAEKSISVTGTIPEGVSVAYTNAKGTNAGVYNAKATLTGEGYNTLTLTATLTVSKADITGITVEAEQSVLSDGEYHKPTVSGNLPAGVTVKYFFDGEESADGVRAIGTYAARVVLSGDNYNEKSFDLSFKVKINLTNFASSLVTSFGSVPDVWEFLPDSFAVENRAVTAADIPNYSTFVNVADIPLNGMGKQLNMVYGILTKTESILSYVNVVYSAMNTIQSLYSDFIDNNPDDYQTFTATAGGFTFTINVTGSEYSISATVSSVEVTLYSSPENSTYAAKIKLSDSNVLKYEVGNGSLKIALNVLNSGVFQIEFARNNNVTVGYIYEYLTALGHDIVAASAMIHVAEDYTTIIGTKGDFIVGYDGRNCEVYRNSDGVLVGTEVKESKNSTAFNTYWLPLANLSGVNTIKKVDEQNTLNADTIYINGSSEAIHIKKFGGLDINKAFSRAFDIEFKTMYFYEYNQTEEKWEEKKIEIPMLFVQEEKLASFSADFADANSVALGGASVSLNTSKNVYDAIDYAYETILSQYEVIKTSVTKEDIIAYCS